MNIAYNSTNEELECLATTHIDSLFRAEVVWLLNNSMKRLAVSEAELETANKRIEELEGELEMLEDQIGQAEHDRDCSDDDLVQLKSDIMELIQ